VDACPSGATFKSDDGVVRVDKDLCIGCGYCVAACPYDARFIDPVAKKVDKCDFCIARLERGQQPACVTTCTARAKTFGDLEDPRSDVHRMVYLEGARRLETREIAVGPNVYYLGKPGQLDLVAASFPPHRPRLLAAGEAWSRLAKPLVLLAVGATFAGQAIAFFNQLNKGEEDFEG
jgi:tetrathionate reductase subunit B